VLVAKSPANPVSDVNNVPRDPAPPPRLPVNGLAEIPTLGIIAPRVEPRPEPPLTKGADVKLVRADVNILNSPYNLFICGF